MISESQKLKGKKYTTSRKTWQKNVKKFCFRSRLSECVEKYTKSRICRKKKLFNPFSTFVSMTGNNSCTRKSRLSFVRSNRRTWNVRQWVTIEACVKYHFFFGWLNFQFQMIRIHLQCAVAVLIRWLHFVTFIYPTHHSTCISISSIFLLFLLDKE